MTVQSINDFPSSLLRAARGSSFSYTFASIRDFKRSEIANKLKDLMDSHGSDKADDAHMYHLVYGAIVLAHGRIEKVFEIGLGSNNTTVVSSMGENGRR